jgi:hypothetical protein
MIKFASVQQKSSSDMTKWLNKNQESKYIYPGVEGEQYEA